MKISADSLILCFLRRKPLAAEDRGMQGLAKDGREMELQP